MNVFEFRDKVVNEYESFSRSFAKFGAEDIKQFVDGIYSTQHFTPSPLVQLNPFFVPGRKVDQLVKNGVLDPLCEKIFRIGKKGDESGISLPLHKHQDEAIQCAQKDESYVITTGTGSGKSLCYFIPIVDAILKEKQSGASTSGRIRAIVIYPMNALCNSQLEELQKFLVEGFPKGTEPVTFGRYTGQESQDERHALAANPPDIILTNFMMLELIMTRQNDLDKAIVKAAHGLRFLVLDELHTYRGRQGSDVALLIRRVRQAFNPDLLCVGTSATMASEGDAASRSKKVAEVSSRLFGRLVKPENIIIETLQRISDSAVKFGQQELQVELNKSVPNHVTYEQLQVHPISAWIEMNLGLTNEGDKLIRAYPKNINQAAQLLAEQSGQSLDVCQGYLTKFLLLAYNTRNDSGLSFFAFRLHQFVSGPGDLFSTLEKAGERYLTINGQQFKPGDRNKHLFNAVFCRECGQEYFPVWADSSGKQIMGLSPRSLDERSHEDEETKFGFYMPDPTHIWNTHDLETNVPEAWIEYDKNGDPRVKRAQRKYMPQDLATDPSGGCSGEGLDGWYIPGGFRFCLNCHVTYDSFMRSDFSKLSSLSMEGRSSATTVLTLGALRFLLSEANELSPKAKKLLGFSDNRQDASLQAGHFNDFIQVILLRAALLNAITNAPQQTLTDDIITKAVFDSLRLTPNDFMATDNPESVTPFIRKKSEDTLRDIIGYRVYFDLRRGWRLTNPNLEQLGLVRIDYEMLGEHCADDNFWKAAPPLLKNATPEIRSRVAYELLEHLRRGLCIKTTYLDRYKQEEIKNSSFSNLKEPWGLGYDERLTESSYMLPESKSPQSNDYLAFHLSSKSRFGRFLKQASTWGGMQNPDYPAKFQQKDYDEIMAGLLLALNGYVMPIEVGTKTAYQLNAAAIKWVLDDGLKNDGAVAGLRKTDNKFFRDLYRNIASMLDGDSRLLHQLEAREHTAQVEPELREKREAEFREAKLPVMFCSPTMELGVDISELNTVYMRNVPPTPANYAQRSGRAGRSGQPALVITYCAAKAPHDQYFFADPNRMVAGSVNPPTLDLANEELIKSHLHAVWLSETGQKLENSINSLLEMTDTNLPILTNLTASLDTNIARQKAINRGNEILGMLATELTAEMAPWYQKDWLERIIHSAYRSFDNALERWRELYNATVRQLNASHAVQMNAAATEKERKEAKQRYNEARIQQELLLKAKANVSSDFYTYRYLASQGFLPGYNFPRLPLMAYLPAAKETSDRNSFISRPRFLALSEFGPQSLIYHEGNQYRVRKIIVGVRDAVSPELPVIAATLCPACGYGHFGAQKDDGLCNSCKATMEGGTKLVSLYRIENVSTRKAHRITSDEEERMRVGYEMQTTLQFAQEGTALQVTKTVFSEGGEDLLKVHYGPAATVWRINLGWRRRKNKSIYGFNVDPNTGTWCKDSQAPDDVDDSVDSGPVVQRIIPYVEDRRNVLIIYPSGHLDEVAMATIQYIIKRGIEQYFQLEESELMAEPLPSKDERNAILFYESAEGGAGVLTRMAHDVSILSRVISKGLEMCHWQPKNGQWLSNELENTNTDCEAGCYKCLLSYFNQPDHPNIDRHQKDVLDLLCRLIRAEGRKGTEGRSAEDHFDELMRLSNSSLEKAWLTFVSKHGFSLPDRAQWLLEAFSTRPDFLYTNHQAAIYIDGPHHQEDAQKQLDEKITSNLRDAGLIVIRFGTNQESWPEVFHNYPDIFGTGNFK